MATLEEIKNKISSYCELKQEPQIKDEKKFILAIEQEISNIVDKDNIEQLNNFNVVFQDFVDYINQKYSKTHGKLNGKTIRPYLNKILGKKRLEMIR